MNYKCPFCLYQFTEDEVEVEVIDRGMNVHRCPNPATIEEGNERRKCGRRLPPNYLDADSVVIALTGGQGVGKTYYFLALLDQLLHNRALHRIGIQGDVLGSDADKKDIFAAFRAVKEERRLIPTTLIEKALRSVIDLQISKDNRPAKHVYLSFFDNPGERFKDIDYMLDKMANVYKADAMLFLFEPKQIPKLWRTIIPNNAYIQNEDEADSLLTVLNNTIQLIKQANNTQPNYSTRNPSPGFSSRWEAALDRFANISNAGKDSGKIKAPLALAISKFDQLRRAIHVEIPYDETQFEHMCITENGFDRQMVNRISSEIEDIICGEPDGEVRIKQLLKGDVKDSAFFGVKSIDVNKDGVPQRLNPQGVLLPLIWLLIKLKLY